jgi:hypothetical protein
MTDLVAALRQGLLDRYAFEPELGRGGMATVWLARDTQSGTYFEHQLARSGW